MKKFFILITLLFISTAIFAEQLVEISIEITEINNNKAKEYGIKWVDEISTGELFVTNGEGNTVYPSLVEFNDWVRYTPLSAKLKLLQESGSAQVLSNPKLVTKSGTFTENFGRGQNRFSYRNGTFKTRLGKCRSRFSEHCQKAGKIKCYIKKSANYSYCGPYRKL